MNRTVVELTVRSVVGRRRALVLVALPALLLALATFARVVAGGDDDLVGVVVQGLGLGTLMPLLGLIAGTSVIAPEIEDRSIMYVLAKPVSRASVFVSKYAVAVALVVALGAAPIALAAVVVTGSLGSVALAYGVGALAAGMAYGALFCMLPVLTRNAVFIGLAYALVWETLVGQLVPGAQALSIQQWSLALVEWAAGDDGYGITSGSAVELRTGVLALAALTAACIAIGIHRLRGLRLTSGVD